MGQSYRAHLCPRFRLRYRELLESDDHFKFIILIDIIKDKEAGSHSLRKGGALR
jgi:hypothetical protein